MANSALLGRAAELSWLRSLITAAASGKSAVHVLEGEAGVGKTTLLRTVIDDLGPDAVVLWVSGVEAEVDLPFAALQRIVLAHGDIVSRVSEEHRTVLLTASGLEPGTISNRLSIGMALLNLLTTAAGETPALLCVDDAQWIDHESLAAIAFAVNRLFADPVVAVFAQRPASMSTPHLAAFPVRPLKGLDTGSSIELLQRRATGSVERHVATRIALSTGGNPLALVDLGEELTEQHLGGAFLLPDPLPLSQRLQSLYSRQIHELPFETRRWLVIAAAEPAGDVSLVEAAARHEGLPLGASSAAENAQLVSVGERVEFRHPLIRSAAYGSATRPDRRGAQASLAAAAEELGDAGLALSYRAGASDGMDTRLAADLETAADLAGDRGNFPGKTRLLTRAAHASPPADRARRLLLAAEAASYSGALTQARALLAELDSTQLTEADRMRAAANADALKLLDLDDGAFAEQPAYFLKLATMMNQAGSENALWYATNVVRFSWLSGRESRGLDERGMAQGMLDVTDSRPSSPTVHSLRALGELVAGDVTAGRVHYEQAVRLYTGDVQPTSDFLLGFTGVAHAAAHVADEMTRDEVMAALERLTRSSGGDYLLANAVSFRGHFDLVAGRLAYGRTRFAEAATLFDLIGYPADYAPFRAMEAAIRGWSGEPILSRSEMLAGAQECRRIAYGAGVEQWLRGWMLTQMACGDYAASSEVQDELAWDPESVDGHILADLIEVAARNGDRERLESLQRALQGRVDKYPSATGRALLGWSRAVETADADAFQDAIRLLQSTRSFLYVARAHLLLGELLRRARRRAESVSHLRQARALFEREGAAIWVRRVDRELAPLIGTSRTVDSPSAVKLTSQETAVARLAADGETNATIAARLYLSANTVDYHLRKVFRKFGLTSRRQLRAALTEEPAAPTV